MRRAVIIPLLADASTDRKAVGFQHLENVFRGVGTTIYIGVNGSKVYEVMANAYSTNKVQYVNCGVEPNPYIARNLCLSIASMENFDLFTLLDADVIPDVHYLRNLKNYETSAVPQLIKGWVSTVMPTTRTKHFDTLRPLNFEMYGKHTFDWCVGANMSFNRKALDILGPMSEERAGGDGIYGRDFERAGYKVTAAPDVRVLKVVSRMRLQDILRKQLQWALDTPADMIPPVEDAKVFLSELIKDAPDLTEGDSQYPSFVDWCFKLQMTLGRIAAHYDTPTQESDHA